MSETSRPSIRTIHAEGAHGSSDEAYYKRVDMPNHRIDIPAIPVSSHTVFVTVTVVPQVAVPADFADNRTMSELADEQRSFLAGLPDDLVDIDLPIDY